MRKLLLCISIAGCIAAPIVSAQGRSGGGGPPSGTMGGTMGGSQMGGSPHGDFGSRQSIDAQQRSTLRRDNAHSGHEAATPEQALFGLSTADRAKLLKDADLETRKAFGAYQATLAKAQGDGGTTTLTADSVTHAQLSTFALDTQTRAQELRSADRATRKAFGKFQSAMARQQALERAAGAASVNAAFGLDTASRAKLQRDADVDTRKTFGADESTRAKAKSDDDNGN